MEQLNELTKEQSLIADVIFSFYEPGTVLEHTSVIEIDDFIELWAPANRPKLSEIEKVMFICGFKDEKSRKDLSFYVKSNLNRLD